MVERGREADRIKANIAGHRAVKRRGVRQERQRDRRLVRRSRRLGGLGLGLGLLQRRERRPPPPSGARPRAPRAGRAPTAPTPPPARGGGRGAPARSSSPLTQEPEIPPCQSSSQNLLVPGVHVTQARSGLYCTSTSTADYNLDAAQVPLAARRRAQLRARAPAVHDERAARLWPHARARARRARSRRPTAPRTRSPGGASRSRR